MKVHFIAIGGSIMHSLAISLKRRGYIVTGSDDKLFSPSRENLKKENLLFKEGWFPNKITSDLDFIILGMHAKIDNLELKEAIKKKIKIYSFPEYIALESKNKKRVVISGSHGKTTITSMIMHVLNAKSIKFDYLVGAKIKGFNNMVHLSDNKMIIIEGDEYLSSKLDSKPKFLHYNPHLLVLSGISWDHVNVFPTYYSYSNAFINLLKTNKSDCKVFYANNDKELKKIIRYSRGGAKSYGLPDFLISNGSVFVKNNGMEYKLSVFGKHNLYNLEAARSICNELGVKNKFFFQSIMSFSGAKKRLELFHIINSKSFIYRDFAHSPSKVQASIEALKDLFPKTRLISCLELHTFSSLTFNFLLQYQDVFKKSDYVWILFSPKEIKNKGLQLFSKEDVFRLINHKKIKVFDDKSELVKVFNETVWVETNLLLMSSGTFQGLDFKELIRSWK